MGALSIGDETAMVPVLVRYVPAIMTVEVLLGETVVTFGAALGGLACKRLACLLLAIQKLPPGYARLHHQLSWECKAASRDYLAVETPAIASLATMVKSEEEVLEITFDLLLSHANATTTRGFFTDIERYVNCLPDPTTRASAIAFIRRLKAPTMLWKLRSPFISLCVNV